jgi:signal transduction histidine kinase
MAGEEQVVIAEQTSPARGSALSLQIALSAIAGFVTTLVWVLVGGGYYWPRWVWFGAAAAAGLHVVIVRALSSEPGPYRALRIQAEASALLVGVEVAVWALSGGGLFWPIWVLSALATALAVHWVVVRHRDGGREQQLVERVDVLTRTRRGAVDVQAAELRRIERDLHDGAQARLVALSMHLGRAEARLDDQPELADLLRQAREEAGSAISELRDLARGISPPVLADRGLAAALDGLGRRSAIPVTVDAQIDRRPPPVVETAAYFVAAEALTNAAKHTGGAAARVRAVEENDVLIVEVSDSGRGGANPDGGGLTGLRHRVEALDGRLTVTSPVGGGTVVRAELPCGS